MGQMASSNSSTRKNDAEAPPSAAALRAALEARCHEGSPSGAWRAAAVAAGVSGTDAFLCHLSRSITGSLESLASSAEASRLRLLSVRESRPADTIFQSHCDDLESCVEAAETTKRVALERELCAVDAALERLRAEWGGVTEAISSLSDAELVTRHAALEAGLDAAEALLLALPTNVVEPPHVGLALDEQALLAGVADFGRVFAPRAVTAADLAVGGAPPRKAFPGCTLDLRLALESPHHASQSAEELELSLGAAAAATHVEASLTAPGAAPQPLQPAVSADVPGRGLTVSIVVSSAVPVDSTICFGPLTVAGQPVAGPLLGMLLVEPPGPADLSPEHAAQLQAWLPRGGSSRPSDWKEVYRATTHGFGAAAFHAHCDKRARLLVLVRAMEGGWLFGGFTAVGFSPPEQYIADPAAFLFSLTNSLGHPEKLESLCTGWDVRYDASWSAQFGGGPSDLLLCSGANTVASSYTNPGHAFAAPASTGAHPMAQGEQRGWFAAEVVAWAV